jgi:hypothetical protein
MNSADSPKPSHPSLSSLPTSPSAQDVRDFADHVDDLRRALWTLASSRPQTRCARAASRVRASLGDTTDPLHDLARCLEAEAIVRMVPGASDGGR